MTELPGRVSLSDNTAPLSTHSQGALVDTNKKPGMVLVTQLVVSFVLKICIDFHGGIISVLIR